MSAVRHIALIAMLVAPLPLAPAARADRTWVTDADGREMRVGFDLGSRVIAGVVYAADSDGGGWGFDGGFLFRRRDDEGVQWKLDHALIAGRIRDDGVIDATFYRGLYLRWSKDGALTIPTVPPAKILLPFDLGFDVSVGRLRVDPATDSLRFGVVSADLLFDFWRCYQFGSYLTLRTGLAYEVAADRFLTTTATHIVTPLSRVGLDFAHTFDAGRETFEAHVAFSHRTYVTGRDQRWSSDADASIAYEVVLLALDDSPISLRVAGGWRWDEARDAHVVSGSVGLRYGLPLD